MAGYTKFDNATLEQVLTANLTKRQLKILLLIIRFSSGCQKSYAVLRRNDFGYAGISQYCIRQELEKLVQLRVIKWDPSRDLVWINPRLKEWAVENSGDKTGDNLGRFFKIASKNLPKWQQSAYQNRNRRLANSARPLMEAEAGKERSKKTKESTFLKLLNDYFLQVAPLSADEMEILRELVKRYPFRLLEEAIEEVASGNRRNFSQFLKAVDDLSSVTSPRQEGLSSIRGRVKQRLKTLQGR